MLFLQLQGNPCVSIERNALVEERIKKIKQGKNGLRRRRPGSILTGNNSSSVRSKGNYLLTKTDISTLGEKGNIQWYTIV